MSSDFWQDKNVIVTGAGGFLGKHLCEILDKVDCNLLAVSTRNGDLRYSGDIRHLLNCFKSIDVLINLAANVGGIGYNQKHPYHLFYDNATIGLNLIDAAIKHKVKKFIQVGTVCSYPKFGYPPYSEEQLWDGYPEETNAPYGLAKKMLLVQLQAARQEFGFNGIYLIPTNLYGPCFSSDTDIITIEGIKNIKDININDKVYTLNPDTNMVELASVVATQKAVTNEFFNFNSQTVDFRVTPDHKIYYRTQKTFLKREAETFRGKLNNTSQITMAHHLPIYNSMPISDEAYYISLIDCIDDNHILTADGVRDYQHSKSKLFPLTYDWRDWIEFLGWFITEGCITNGFPEHRTYGQIRITQSENRNSENYYRIKDLLDRMGIPYGHDGMNFYFASRMFRNYLEANIGKTAETKQMPNFVFDEDFPTHLRYLLYETLMRGDGHKTRKRSRYTTKSEKLKNSFIHLCFLLGLKTTAYFDNECWRIGIRHHKFNSTVKNKNIVVEDVYQETVYCFTVDKNHLVYAGRNGKFNWIGQCDNFASDKSHVIPALIKKCIEARDNGLDHITVWGTGKATRDFLYVKDAAKAIISAAEKYDSGYPLNLGSGQEIRISSLIHLITQLTGYEGNIKWDTSKPDGQPRRVLNSSSAEQAIGWKAETKLRDGLKETIEWYQGNVVCQGQ